MAHNKNTENPSQSPGHGTIVVARNGDVIRYDRSGLIMRLSDKVIDDIALRLGTKPAPDATPAVSGALERADPHEYLEEVDAWDVRIEGEWLFFSANLPGRQGVRGYRRLIEGGDIIGDAPGPLVGILGIGGPRAAIATPNKSNFPQHILAPADDIGAVGHAGIEDAKQLNHLEHLREMTHEALMAEAFISWQLEKVAAFPIFVTRVETDSAATARELSKGKAFDNLIAAASNLSLSAKRLGKKPKLMCVTLDYSLEDISGDAVAYRDGMLALMKRAEDELFKLGFDNPVFVSRLESGTIDVTNAAVIKGQWELSWNHGAHRLIYSAPGYMFEQDSFNRPTAQARVEMAEMTAAAVTDPDKWQCPIFFLAEQSVSDDKIIRVVGRAPTDLVIDNTDPFRAGKTAGFRLIGATNNAQITSVSIDPDDPKTIVLRLSIAPKGSDIGVAYAYGADPREGNFPANCGAIRDQWSMRSAAGGILHRWALPCVLPMTVGGRDA